MGFETLIDARFECAGGIIVRDEPGEHSAPSGGGEGAGILGHARIRRMECADCNPWNLLNSKD